ncbi:MAG: biopolymer transporter ExbD [Synechococcaceae cyanobacterium SM1_2_3]|nr:biopolymer transporter ExbD [Synechococcaceae cyanobacterium SM1_2_3]
MNLRPRRREDPEINLVPMIDVVLVLLIFFMLATSLKPETALDIRLPEASGQPMPTDQTQLTVEIDASGRYTINGAALANADASALKAALQTAAKGRELPLILRADGRTPHQAVVTVLEVAGELGLKQLAIAARDAPESAPPTPNPSTLRTP